MSPQNGWPRSSAHHEGRRIAGGLWSVILAPHSPSCPGSAYGRLRSFLSNFGARARQETCGRPSAAYVLRPAQKPWINVSAETMGIPAGSDGKPGQRYSQRTQIAGLRLLGRSTRQKKHCLACIRNRARRRPTLKSQQITTAPVPGSAARYLINDRVSQQPAFRRYSPAHAFSPTRTR
jgi:hypothetical protein